MNANRDAIPSPCICVCYLNDEDICLGCFRTLHEITCWRQVDEKTRGHILNNARQRQQAQQKLID